MKHVNKEHMHDLGKYLFAFSILWAYLWFSQYLLIWYSNIPEETVYYVQRLKDYNTLFFVNLVLNFVIPFIILMTRNSKRMDLILGVTSAIIYVGHWVDYYLVIMPGLTGKQLSIGIFEVALNVGYIGVFLMVVFYYLSKADLIPSKHPYFKESLDYQG